MKENTHREPTLYIVGNPNRAEEIKHLIEDEWGGDNVGEYKYNDYSSAYYIGFVGIVNQIFLKDDWFNKAVKNGWMKEYKLPEKPFKPFDKVVVREYSGVWRVDFFSHIDHDSPEFQFACVCSNYNTCLPYNEKTEKLIGTTDEWKGGE